LAQQKQGRIKAFAPVFVAFRSVASRSDSDR